MAKRAPKRTKCEGSGEQAWLQHSITSFYNGGAECLICDKIVEFKKRTVKKSKYRNKLAGTFKVHYIYDLEDAFK